ncbi:hypothetical protein [Candidatus Sororendozoicomonas aggregata]|uniref:hypothetical protein n=1 Tax=Candidatus Sororendozoicomonas aggregata TaxID=3073239 RepID=UPI002ED28C23
MDEHSSHSPKHTPEELIKALETYNDPVKLQQLLADTVEDIKTFEEELSELHSQIRGLPAKISAINAKLASMEAASEPSEGAVECAHHQQMLTQMNENYRVLSLRERTVEGFLLNLRKEQDDISSQLKILAVKGEMPSIDNPKKPQ